MTLNTFKPIRRLVAANNEQGQSYVLFDGPAPKAHQRETGPVRGHTDLWVWNQTPLPLGGSSDAGNLPYDFPGSANGGHLRAVQSRSKPSSYDPASDPAIVPEHPVKVMANGRRWDRGGSTTFIGAMHKTQTIDYAILVEGERVLELDDREVRWQPGDVVIDVGGWHRWNSPNEDGIVVFDMITAEFVDGPDGLIQGNDPILVGKPKMPLPPGVEPTRRIVVGDCEPGLSKVLSDGFSPEIYLDPARPGYASSKLWVVKDFPAKLFFETIHLPYLMIPPKGGSLCRMLTLPPDQSWQGKIGPKEVENFFADMKAPFASTYSKDAKHPYMQKTETMDFCVVISGQATLILDTEERQVSAGDVVILRGVNHAWSNHSDGPVKIAIASHDADFQAHDS
jgi:quercetin dioxygenase-like cupin family protein